jgi:hypothetical protein
LKEKHEAGSKTTFYSLWKAVHQDTLHDMEKSAQRKKASVAVLMELERQLVNARKEISSLREREDKSNEELIDQRAEKRTEVLYEAFAKKKAKNKDLKQKLKLLTAELEDQKTQLEQCKGTMLEMKEIKEELEGLYNEMKINISEEKGKVKALEDRAAKFRYTLHKLKKLFLAVHTTLESFVHLTQHQEVIEAVLIPQNHEFCIRKGSMFDTLGLLCVTANEALKEKGNIFADFLSPGTGGKKQSFHEKSFSDFVEARLTDSLKHFSGFLGQAAKNYEAEKSKLLEHVSEILNILLNYKKLFTL